MSGEAEEAINNVRAAEGIAPLRHDARLAQVAQGYARRMAAEGFFSHNDAEGKSVIDRVNASGYRWSVVGENLAKIKTRRDNEVGFAVNGWMNSPVHKANILRRDYADSAIGVARAADGTTYLVQVFAAPI